MTLLPYPPMRHVSPPVDGDSPWYPPRSQLLAGAKAWWELDVYGGGVLVGLYEGGVLRFFEGQEPHPGYRRVEHERETTVEKVLSTREAPFLTTDFQFLEELLSDLAALED